MPNLCDAFGDTKLVLLPAISSICGAKIYVKLENTNPGGGSVKDRVALNLIRCAERQGKLSSGGTVVEGTGEHRIRARHCCEFPRIQDNLDNA